MKLSLYIESKIAIILLNAALITFIVVFINFIFNVDGIIVLFFVLIWLMILLCYLCISYFVTKKRYDKIVSLVDNLEEKYLISEILPKNISCEEIAYAYALKCACKSMNDKISNIYSDSVEYKEYIETWVHEIKTPISAISLLCINKNDKKLQGEINKIDNLVEQVLYYARSENTEKDYFVKELYLEDIIHGSLINFKDVILKEKINLNVYDLNYKVYTDEKWINFILNQIIFNSIKYLYVEDKNLSIHSVLDNSGNVILIIEDSGIGITESDLPRIFEKGFTGSNRKKEHSTGMGLYICKKLCDRLNLLIDAESEEKKFTRIKITFPKGKVHKLE